MPEPRTQPTSVGVSLLGWQAAREAASAIRTRVFVAEQGVPEALELDDHDAACRHALACTEDGEAVATGRLLPDGHIGRVAVLPAWRGQGIGQQVMAALMDEARRLGMKEVLLNAQLSATGFYLALGFAPQGEVFMEAGIAHQAMRRSLA